MSLDPMMISNVLRLLEKKWYIVRTKSTPWSVANTLWLSKIGDDVITKAHDVVVHLEKTLFDDVWDKKFKKCLKNVAEAAK
jgi:DNA-binding MarR family transcriptional regulator